MPLFVKWKEEIRFKAGLRMIIGWEGNGLKEPMALVEEFTPAGLIFFRRNYPPGGGNELRDQLAALQKRSLELTGRPLIMALDNEGGLVKRLPPPHIQLPGANEQAERGVTFTRSMALSSGKELKELGFNLNLAPVLDLIVPDGIMTKRGYGEDPEKVIQLTQGFVTGFREAGVFCCGKHFPGLGAAMEDPHEVVSAVHLTEAQMEDHLKPFIALIEKGLAAIMTSHCLYPGLGIKEISTFSPAIINLLRYKLNFDGLVLSDDLEMGAVANKLKIGQAALEALIAGHDAVLICRKRPLIEETHRILVESMVVGELKGERFGASVTRLETFLEGLKSDF
ncbi:MAG: beta-N-acetylhexosaminidase [Deltaproteobacteria bacterium]|jgi:beta-N-acetylhexosaminidase|nr:beta-N-acetylhexosaminidase [Deltaproteobacteria bacterium]